MAKLLDLKGLKYYDSLLRTHITNEIDLSFANANAHFESTDGTINITKDLTNVKVDFGVKIDNDTIKKNANGSLYVDTSTVSPDYTGSNAIQISNDRISLKIDNNDKFLSQSTNGLIDNLRITQLQDTSSLGTNIKEAWALQDKNGNAIIGDNYDLVIKIYKDNSLLSVKLLHAVPAVYYTQEEIDTAQEGDDAYGKTTEDIKTPAVIPVYSNVTGWIDIIPELRVDKNLALCFAYQTVDGINVEAILVGAFLMETEFSSEFSINDGVVSIKSITTSDIDRLLYPLE